MGWPQLWNEPWPVGSLVLQPKGEWWREGRLSLVSGNRWHSLSANPSGMYIPTSQSQLKYVLGAESCFPLLFNCTQPEHDLASCLHWQKLKCFSLPRKPVSILCKSPKMLWSRAEAVICVCAGMSAAFPAQGIELGKKLCCGLWLCYAQRGAFLQPWFLCSWRAAVFPARLW